MRWISGSRRVVALFVALVVAAPAAAQVVRGSVRSVESSLPIPLVQITLRDSMGIVLGTASSDDQGFFVIRSFAARPFVVHARRLGYQFANTDMLSFGVGDTLDLEFQLAQVAFEADAMEVSGMATLNEQRLQEALRRGWRVYEPQVVAQHRDRARDLSDLMRSLGTQSLVMPRTSRECVRNLRTNGCVTFVVDGQVLGPENLLMAPSEIYFMALLSPSEAQVLYGSRGMHGAIAIFTRSHGDRYGEPPPTRAPTKAPAASARRP